MKTGTINKITSQRLRWAAYVWRQPDNRFSTLSGEKAPEGKDFQDNSGWDVGKYYDPSQKYGHR